MAARETPAETIERLLRAGDNVGALRACDELLAKAPNSFVARLGRARAFTELGRGIEAERELDAALRLSPRDEHANLLRASVDAERGRADTAADSDGHNSGSTHAHTPRTTITQFGDGLN